MNRLIAVAPERKCVAHKNERRDLGRQACRVKMRWFGLEHGQTVGGAGYQARSLSFGRARHTVRVSREARTVGMLGGFAPPTAADAHHAAKALF